MLDEVEWSGDGVTALVLLVLGLTFVAFGFAWGRSRAITVVAFVLTVASVGLDALYFLFDVNLAGYCEEPKCDPGPIPMSIMLIVLPVPLALTYIGVHVRRVRREARSEGA
ncbi:MAG TPA: hypothetical protein VF517_16310 [Thermoleophilaceae bacterium]